MAETLKITSTGSGLPIVLIHGWGLNSGIWQPSIECLQTHFEVISVDLPGFGLNVENTLSEYSLVNVAKLVEAAINKPAVYLGWSLGGLIATQIALNAPDKVKALITVASSPCFVENEEWPGIKADVLSLFHRQLLDDTKKTIDGFLKVQAMGSPNLRQDIKQIKALIMQYELPSRKTLDDALMLLETVDQRDELVNIHCPILRMYGRLDGLVPKKMIPLMNDLAVDSESYLFEQASHAPFISQLDEFISVLCKWLAKIK